MRIVVAYQYYQSTNAPGHSLIYDWTQYLAKQGHEVIVVAGETGYMSCSKTAVPWYRRFARTERIGDISVLRTYSYSELHRSYLGRLLSFVSFSVSSFITLCFIKKPDVMVGSSPPIFPVFAAWLASKLRRIPFVMEVRDLWPESAIQMGILKNKRLIQVMTWMERILYDQSRTIITLTEGIRNDICRRGWPKEKMTLVECGVDTTQLYPDFEGGLAIRKRYRLEDKRIILYFGALGAANNIPVILRAAKRLLLHEDIVFMLVGDGMQSAEIEKTIQELALTNVLLHKAVPKDQARLYINAADVCLVTLLDIPLFSGALPTKLFDYMACGKPVLCGVMGEAKRIIDESRVGLTFPPNDDKLLQELLLTTLEDMLNVSKSALNGIEFIKNNYESSKMHRLIEGVVIDAGTIKPRAC